MSLCAPDGRRPSLIKLLQSRLRNPLGEKAYAVPTGPTLRAGRGNLLGSVPPDRPPPVEQVVPGRGTLTADQ